MHQEQNPPPERRDIRRSLPRSSLPSSTRPPPPPPLPPRRLPQRRRETADASREYENGGNDDGGQDGVRCGQNGVTNDDRKDGNGASTPAAARTGGCRGEAVTTTTATPDSTTVTTSDGDDPDDSGEGRVVAFADADARFDSCPGPGTARPDPSNVEVRLEYDYELHAPTANATDVRPVARILEENMLEVLASYLGLLDCRLERGSDGGRGRRGAKRGRRSLVAREEYGASHDAARRGLQLREEEKRSITAATSELADIVDVAHEHGTSVKKKQRTNGKQ